jgi:hypothetical protein
LQRRVIFGFFAALFAITLLLRLCHAQLLWPDEDYHLAAAMQLLRGKFLYRDFWYDKPPLSALTYALMGAPTGWALRLFDAVWISAICAVAFRFATDVFGEREGLIAAGTIAFFLNFDLPGGIIPIAPDFFMVLPHLLAMWCAWRGKPLAAGGWCGIAFLFNPKGVFVLIACAMLLWRSMPLLLLGFLIPNLVTMATFFAQDAAGPYIEQVWRWGLIYAKTPPAASSIGEGLRRSLDWFGFHAALIFAAGCYWWKARTRAAAFLAVWAVVSLTAVASGGRFSNRYFLQLLPAVAVAAAAMPRRRIYIAISALALCVPFVRFGPRYAALALDNFAARESLWSDTALDRDSRNVAVWLAANSIPGDALFIWGYRPDVIVYSGMPFASFYWDSQPLTGVPADRHLTESLSLIPEWAARNRRDLVASRPAFIVDGLSLLNPRLAMNEFPETRTWLASYEIVHRTKLSMIYRRIPR